MDNKAIVMDFEQLKRELKQRGKGEDNSAINLFGKIHFCKLLHSYDFYGHCIQEQENGQWRTYFEERGKIYDVKYYSSEDEACCEYLKWIDRVLNNRQSFEYIKREELIAILETHPEDMNVVIDERITGKRSLIDTIEGGINSPYEKDNWDGFRDAIGALEWVTDRKIRFIHLGLPVLDVKDAQIYYSIMSEVSSRWSDEKGQMYARKQNVEVHFIFAADLKDKVEAILSRL